MSTPEYLHITCPNCGSSKVGYSADKELMLCGHCGFTRPLPKDSDQVIERPLSTGFKQEGFPTGLSLEVKEFHCENCGSNRMLEPNQVRVECPFCGSENVNETAHLTKIIQPSAILPFTFPRKKAEAVFREWIGRRGLFRPNKLGKLADINNLHGIYLPFWTFDANTQSSWHALAGYYYRETENYVDKDKNPQTREVRKTRWQPASGYFEHFFDDTLVIASHILKQKDIDKIKPFDMEHLVNYDSQYLLGWECEVYQKDIKEGFEDAEKIMDAYIREQCRKRVPGDTHRELEVKTDKNRLTFKHILLPVWTAGYTYKNKPYQLLINGRTGKISGEKPLSVYKVVGAILAAAAVIVALVYFFEKMN